MEGFSMHLWQFTVVMYGSGEDKEEAWKDAVESFADDPVGPSIADDCGEDENEDPPDNPKKVYSYACFEETLEFAEGLGWSVRNPDEWDGDDLETDALDHITKSGYEVVYHADNQATGATDAKHMDQDTLMST